MRPCTSFAAAAGKFPIASPRPSICFSTAAAFLVGGASALALAPRAAMAQRISDLANLPDPTADLYPAKRNAKYVLDRPITDEKVNANYNNFYEFDVVETHRRAGAKAARSGRGR